MGNLDRLAGALALATITVCSAARADDDCDFRTRGSTLTLRADCRTDATLVIPDGMTLDGRGHRITAVDPPGGSFLGAVVKNGGSTASVRRLIIDTNALRNVCGTAQDRLRGILFEGASGSVMHSQVLDIRKAEGGCQGGHAIEVRGAEQGSNEVSIIDNHIEGYQKTGVLAVGDVEVTVSLNRIYGLGATERIAQNGIQLSSGATGSLTLNHVEGNHYTPATFTSTGILLLDAGEGIEVKLNDVVFNDVGIYVSATSGAAVSGNRVRRATSDSISIDGRSGPAEDNRVTGNDVRGGSNGIGIFGDGAQGNLIARNRVRGCSNDGIYATFGADANQIQQSQVRDCGRGIVIESDENVVIGNHVRGSELAGIEVTGTGNVVGRNFVF